MPDAIVHVTFSARTWRGSEPRGQRPLDFLREFLGTEFDTIVGTTINVEPSRVLLRWSDHDDCSKNAHDLEIDVRYTGEVGKAAAWERITWANKIAESVSAAAAEVFPSFKFSVSVQVRYQPHAQVTYIGGTPAGSR